MAYVDCDLYEPALECCEFFYDRTPPGGVLLFHDYTIEGLEVPSWQRAPFGGIRRAVSEFMTGRPEKVVEFPETMHAVVIRS